MQNTTTNKNKFQFMATSLIVWNASKALMSREESTQAAEILTKRIPGCTIEFSAKEMKPIYSEAKMYYGLMVTVDNVPVEPRVSISDYSTYRQKMSGKN